MTIFFIADLHLGHENVLKYCNRPFDNSARMDEVLVREWNKKVFRSDTIYILGDLAFGSSQYKIEIVRKLRGQKHLILGNHDGKPNLALKKLFVSVSHYKEIGVPDDEIDDGHKQPIILSHYPFETWNKKLQGSWMLHGHSHGALKTIQPARLDVGVDCHAYKPISYQEVKTILTKRLLGKD